MISTNQLKMYNDREKRDARKKGTKKAPRTMHRLQGTPYTGIHTIAHLPTFRMSVYVSTV